MNHASYVSLPVHWSTERERIRLLTSSTASPGQCGNKSLHVSSVAETRWSSFFTLHHTTCCVGLASAKHYTSSTKNPAPPNQRHIPSVSVFVGLVESMDWSPRTWKESRWRADMNVFHLMSYTWKVSLMAVISLPKHRTPLGHGDWYFVFSRFMLLTRYCSIVGTLSYSISNGLMLDVLNALAVLITDRIPAFSRHW